MDLEQAIKTAIDYELKVQQAYEQAKAEATNETGQRVFGFLAEEEAGHVAYLNSRLELWKKSGKLTIEKLDTVIPTKAVIEASMSKLKDDLGGKPEPGDGELELLKKALKAEEETSAFYKQMVKELDGDAKKLFERFVEIEDGHVAIVEAEIAAVSGMGFWFDIPEFNIAHS
jgi:rubrerythrin